MSEVDGSWDVIVVGAGLGGLAAATRLGQLGLRPLVLEQHNLAVVQLLDLSLDRPEEFIEEPHRCAKLLFDLGRKGPKRQVFHPSTSRPPEMRHENHPAAFVAQPLDGWHGSACWRYDSNPGSSFGDCRAFRRK